MNRDINPYSAPSHASSLYGTLEPQIMEHYPAAEMIVRNCPIKLSFECPRTWSSLTLTEQPDARICLHCKRRVYLCADIDEARARGKNGDCIAYADPNAGMFLGEVDLSY